MKLDFAAAGRDQCVDRSRVNNDVIVEWRRAQPERETKSGGKDGIFYYVV